MFMYLYVYLNPENSFVANRGQLISLCVYAPVLCETRISRLIERHHYSPAFMIYILKDNVYGVHCTYTYGVYVRMVYIHIPVVYMEKEIRQHPLC